MEEAPRVRLASRLLLVGVLMWLYLAGVGEQWLLVDDAWISFRYADHLVQGHGLVWNPGERVEGYTNFLWVMVMAGLIGAGGDPEWWSCALGIGAGLGVLALTVELGRQARGEDSPFIWLAPGLLVVHRSFLAWSTGGLETMATAALVLGGFVAHLREREGEGASVPVSGLLLGLATLCRPDAGLFALVVLAVSTFDGWRRLGPGPALRTSLGWGLAYAALPGLHLLWRLTYYGTLLPNTFHAKVNGTWFEQGGRYLGLFVGDFALWWVLPFAVLGVALAREYRHVLLATAVIAHSLYLAALGGDVFEFRLLVVILAPLYWLWAEGLAELAGRAGQRWPAAAPVMTLGALLLAVPPIVRTVAASRIPALNVTRHGVDSLAAVRAFGTLRQREGRALRELIERGVLPDDLHWATGGAGAIPYYTGWITTDRHGLSDREVARGALESRGRPGHEHWASDEHLRARGVELIELLPTMLLLHPPSAEAREIVAVPGRQQHVLKVQGSFGTRYMFFAVFDEDEATFRERFAGAEIVE